MRIPIAAAAAVLLTGCEVYAVPSPLPCPGERQGVFDFSATQVVDANDCFFAQPENPAYQVKPSFPFTATISFDTTGDGAALCVQEPHALPNIGTHADLSIDVASENVLDVGGCTCLTPEAAAAGGCDCPPNTPQTCSCSVIQQQRITGGLIAIPGGYSGFDGSLVYTVTPPPLPPLAQPCDCHVSCTYAYALTATTVGTR